MNAHVRDLRPDRPLEGRIVRVEAVAPMVLEHLVLDTTEHVRPVVIVGHRPAIKWMVVAAGALEAGAEEKLRRGLGASDRIAVGAIKIGRRIAIGAAAGGEYFAHEPVHRFVLRDALANPIVKDLNSFPVEHLLFVA